MPRCETSSPPDDTALMRCRLRRLRWEWSLAPGDVEALLGLSEAALFQVARECGSVLSGRIHARIRMLDEIASLAWAVPFPGDPADWLRAPTAGLDGRTPLEVLAKGSRGVVQVISNLRSFIGEAGR